jgi:hypothetical protein
MRRSIRTIESSFRRSVAEDVFRPLGLKLSAVIEWIVKLVDNTMGIFNEDNELDADVPVMPL